MYIKSGLLPFDPPAKRFGIHSTPASLGLCYSEDPSGGLQTIPERIIWYRVPHDFISHQYKSHELETLDLLRSNSGIVVVGGASSLEWRNK